MSDQLCQECGLPIKVCNALASYRYAIERVRQGNMIAALDFAESAKTFHDAYLEEYKAQR